MTLIPTENIIDIPDHSYWLDAFESLDDIKQKTDAQFLSLSHWYKLESLDLSPISKLKNIRGLTLSTTLSWDGSNRHLLVNSFSPLAELPNLESLHIHGVIPQDNDISPLGRISSLKEIILSHSNYYQVEHYAKLSAQNPELKGCEPITEMNFILTCKKCNSERMLYLNGTKPRARRYVCPKCNIKLILSHIARWNQAGGLPQHSLEGMKPREIWEIFGNPNAT